MPTAWDQLLDQIDRRAARAADRPSAPPEDVLRPLVAQAIADRDVDAELEPDDVVRWLTGLLTALDAVRGADPDGDADRDVANLRRIVTRWLHPARPR